MKDKLLKTAPPQWLKLSSPASFYSAMPESPSLRLNREQKRPFISFRRKLSDFVFCYWWWWYYDYVKFHTGEDWLQSMEKLGDDLLMIGDAETVKINGGDCNGVAWRSLLTRVPWIFRGWAFSVIEFFTFSLRVCYLMWFFCYDSLLSFSVMFVLLLIFLSCFPVDD